MRRRAVGEEEAYEAEAAPRQQGYPERDVLAGGLHPAANVRAPLEEEGDHALVAVDGSPAEGSARPALVDGGLLVIAGEVAIEGGLRPQRPDLAMAGSDGIPHLFARHAALAPVAPVPEGVFDTDAALVGTPEDLAGGRPVLGVFREGHVFWPAVWLFEARQGALDVTSLNEGARKSLLGEQIGSMRLGAGARREGDLILAAPGEAGHVAFGPYLPLSAGAYRALVEVDVAFARQDVRVELVAEVAFGSHIAARQAVLMTGAQASQQAIEMPFRLDRLVPFSEGNGYEQTCEIRLWSNGLAALTIRSVVLVRVAEDAG